MGCDERWTRFASRNAMSKVLQTIIGCLIYGVMFATAGVVVALIIPALVWLAAEFQGPPRNLLFPTIGDAYTSPRHGKEILLGVAILFFLFGFVYVPIAKWENSRKSKKYDRSPQRAAAEVVSDEKVFYFDCSRLWWGLAVGLFVSISSLGFLYVPIAVIVDAGGVGFGGVGFGTIALAAIAAAAIALISAALFSSETLFYLRILQHRGPALVIGPVGIQAHHLGPKTIPWGEIAQVRCLRNHLELTLDPSRRPSSWLVRRRISSGKIPRLFGWTNGELTINFWILSATQDDMVLAVRKFAPEIDLRASQ